MQQINILFFLRILYIIHDVLHKKKVFQSFTNIDKNKCIVGEKISINFVHI